MKLNNKGFAISTIMYMVLILALAITITTLTILNNRGKILEKLKQSVASEINDTTDDNNYLCYLKEGTGLEIGDLYNCQVSNTEEYDFYLLKSTDTTADFIMSSNITFGSGKYDNTIVDNNSLVKYNSDNSLTPKDALAVLKILTDNWFYLDSRTDTIDNIDYTTYKARLLSFDDISSYVTDNVLTNSIINNTLTSTIYNGNLIYSVDDNKIITEKNKSDEYYIVPVITINKEQIKG